jgi:hypothetical protein
LSGALTGNEVKLVWVARGTGRKEEKNQGFGFFALSNFRDAELIQ